jgi:hypothetical protein
MVKIRTSDEYLRHLRCGDYLMSPKRNSSFSQVCDRIAYSGILFLRNSLNSMVEVLTSRMVWCAAFLSRNLMLFAVDSYAIANITGPPGSSRALVAAVSKYLRMLVKGGEKELISFDR